MFKTPQREFEESVDRGHQEINIRDSKGQDFRQKFITTAITTVAKTAL